MKKILLILLFAAAALGASAQAEGGDRGRDRQQWFNDMREYKHDFLAQKLDLSREQQNKFFPLYDKMDDELGKINGETRSLERKIREAAEGTTTDLEYDMAIDALYDQKAKEAEIEKSYLDSFKEILTKQQLFKLKSVERQFMMNMMRRHHEIRNGRKSPNNKN